MSHWNHRVIRKTYPDGSIILGIHEVFCDDKGLIWGATVDPKAAMAVERCGKDFEQGENVETLKKILTWMLQACEKPVLNMEDIPEKGAQGIDISDVEGNDSD